MTIKLVLLFMVLFTSFLLFTAVLQLVFMNNRSLQKRMNRYLDLNDKVKLNRKHFNVLVQMQLYKQTVKDKVLTKKKNDKLDQLLARAGLSTKPEEYVLFQWILTALCGGLLFLLTGNIVVGIVGVLLGYMSPRWWVKKKVSDRMNRFNDGLEDMIMTVVGSLRAGFSFTQALKTVVEESESPIKEEMETLLKEMQYGTTMEEALYHLKERMPSEDLELMIQSILIQRQVGGNLAVVLETIVRTIRDRNKIQRQIRTLTAQGRLSGIVIGLLPVVLGFALYLIEPTYIGALFTHPIGLIMVGSAAVSGSIGFVLIRKMTRIEV